MNERIAGLNGRRDGFGIERIAQDPSGARRNTRNRRLPSERANSVTASKKRDNEAAADVPGATGDQYITRLNHVCLLSINVRNLQFPPQSDAKPPLFLPPRRERKGDLCRLF